VNSLQKFNSNKKTQPQLACHFISLGDIKHFADISQNLAMSPKTFENFSLYFAPLFEQSKTLNLGTLISHEFTRLIQSVSTQHRAVAPVDTKICLAT
jgi:hypothetical protein